MVDEAGNDFKSQIGAEVHAHLGELEADVGIEFRVRDGVEQPVVDLRRLVSVAGGSDVFTQAVEGNGEALGAEGDRGTEGVFDTEPGDEARRHATAEAGFFGEAAQAGVLRQADECGPQQGHFVRDQDKLSFLHKGGGRRRIRANFPRSERGVCQNRTVNRPKTTPS